MEIVFKIWILVFFFMNNLNFFKFKLMNVYFELNIFLFNFKKIYIIIVCMDKCIYILILYEDKK